MLKILQISDNLDGTTMKLDPAQLSGDAVADITTSYIQGLISGKALTIGADGYVAFADAGTSVLGLLVDDAKGVAFDNTPALATGLLTVITAGLVESDQIEGSFVAGDKVYAKGGLLTATAPDTNALPFGVCTVGTSADYPVVQFRFGILV